MKTTQSRTFAAIQLLSAWLGLAAWLGWGAAPVSATVAINYNGESPNGGSQYANGVGIVFTVGSQNLVVTNLGATGFCSDWNNTTHTSANLNASPVTVKLWRVSDGALLASVTLNSANWSQTWSPSPANYLMPYLTAATNVTLMSGVQYIIALYGTGPANLQYIASLHTATIKPVVATNYINFNANRYASGGGFIMPNVVDAGSSPSYGGPTFEFSPTVSVIDNSTAGYTTTGFWTSQTFPNVYDSYLANWQYQNSGGAADTAAWTFTGLPSGNYYIAAGTRYGGAGGLTANALFTYSIGGSGFSVNQALGTKHFEDHHPLGQPATPRGPGFARLSTFNGYVPVSITGGTIAVTVSNAAAAGFLTADAVRLEQARADAQKIWVIGNGTTGYSESGSWADWQGENEHNYGYRFSSSGTATFAFTGLDSGFYRVSATWTAGGNRPTQAEYAMPGVSTNIVNQQLAPSGDTFEDVPWKDLFTNIVVSGSTLTVTLRSLDGTKVAIADAVRVEMTGVLGSAPTIIQQPQGGIFATGATATLTVVVTNNPPFTYQWLKNGATNAGAVSDTLTLANLASSDAADYRVIVSNLGGSVTSGVATVTVVRAPVNVNWNSSASTAWDINTSANWLNQFTLLPDFFEPNDAVTFDDTPGLQTNVIIGANVAANPASITVNSTNNHYAITGAGRITGSAGLTKQGPSALTLGTANDFNGAVTVSGGVLKLGAATALGSTNGGTTVSPGATLDLNAQRIAGEPLFLSGSGVDGNGALVNNGANYNISGMPQRVTLNGDTTFGGTGTFEIGRAVGAAFFNGGGFSLTKTNANGFWLVGLTVSSLADITVAGGKLGFDDATGGMGDPARTLTLAPGTILANYSDDAVADTYTKNFVLNGGTVQNEGGAGALTLAGAMTLNGTNIFWNNMTIIAPIAGGGSLVKLGGTLTLTGTNTYLGATRVAGGALALASEGSLASSSGIQIDVGASLVVTGRTDGLFTLSAGQVLSGSGFVLGNVTDTSPGSQFSPGGSAIGTLTVGGNLTLSGSQLYFDITGVTNEGSTFNDLLVVTNLTLSGSNAVVISPLGLLSNSTYTLIRYTGTFTGDPASFVPVSLSRQAFSITHDALAKAILLNVSGPAGNLLWVGDSLGNPVADWDLKLSQNWVPLPDGFPQDFFYSGDAVTFDDSGAIGFVNSYTVNLVAPLFPAYVSVANIYNDFTFSGSGSINGSAGLVKDGSAALVVLNTNAYTGGTTLRGGTLQIGNGVINGWITGTITNNAVLAYDLAQPNSFGGWITGTGQLVKRGAGTLTLTANNAYSGGTIVDGGELVTVGVHPNTPQGTGPLLINPAATFRASTTHILTALARPITNRGTMLLNGYHRPTAPLYLDGGTFCTIGGFSAAWQGFHFLIPVTVLANTAPSIITNTGVNSGLHIRAATAGGTAFTVEDGSAVQDLIVSATLLDPTADESGLGKLIKAGPGLMALNGTAYFSGGVQVNNGTFEINGLIANAANTVTVAGGTLGGTGIVASAVSIQSGGTLAPGASIGTLAISNALTLAGRTVMEIDRAAGPTCDKVVGLTTVTFGGTLAMTNLGDALADGDTFKLFDASNYVGSFASFDLPPLPAGLGWDTTKLSVDGTISVGPLLTISGDVALEFFVGAGPLPVTFVTTRIAGGFTNLLGTFELPLTFAPGPDGYGVASYTLPNVPIGTTHLSAKSPWSLRKKIQAVFAGLLGTAHFTGPSTLPGGDLDGSNLVDIVDYFQLAASWYQANPAADIDGSGWVDLEDYFLLASHWYEVGDPN